MASSKDIFEADIYAAGIFAAGIWRGLGVSAPYVADVVSRECSEPRDVVSRECDYSHDVIS
jgi:hypothetical protein